MATNVKIMNDIRAMASPTYQDRIPEVTEQTFKDVGNALMREDYKLEYNEFLNSMFNKIGLTVVKDAKMKNKLAHFYKGKLTHANDIEEVFVGLTDLKEFDPALAEEKVFEREDQDVKVLFHRENFRGMYKVTISRAQMKNAFHRESGLSSVMRKIINSMYNSWQLDDYLLTKRTLGLQKDKYYDIKVDPVTDRESAEKFIKTVIQNAMDQSFPNDKFNYMGVTRMEDTRNMTLLLHKDIAPIMSVDVLSKAFNKADLQLPAKILYIDDFGMWKNGDGEEVIDTTMSDTVGLLIDNDFLQIWSTEEDTGSIYNPQGLYTNFFYHRWNIYSASYFHNAVRFTTNPQPNKQYDPKKGE